MKKNRMMRAASALLVAVLMTTCTISGTFAKYTTKATGTDTARVAKFGVVITANGETFAKTYDAVDADDAKTVVSSDKVVAPGTEGTMASMTLTGTPEVDVQVTYVGTLDLGDKWVDKDDHYYCPLVIKVNTTTINGMDCTDADDFESKVKAAIDGYSKSYDAGTDLSSDAVKGESLAVSWAWAFETGADADAKAANNIKDTYLAAQAAGITLTVETTVTQVGD